MKAEIDYQEYCQKRYETSKDVLIASLDLKEILKGETKQLSSLIFNSVLIADQFLNEIYIVKKDVHATKSIHKISDILKNSEDK